MSGTTKLGGGSKSAVLATRPREVTTEQLVFLPYNVGKHWILVVMDLSSSVVYYLDSLYTEINSSLEIIINTALKIYETTKGHRRRSSTWKVVKCPKQPPSVACGFYVMRYMKDLSSDQDILTKGNFNGKKIYTDAEIDEVRAEWISFVLRRI